VVTCLGKEQLLYPAPQEPLDFILAQRPRATSNWPAIIGVADLEAERALMQARDDLGNEVSL